MVLDYDDEEEEAIGDDEPIDDEFRGDVTLPPLTVGKKKKREDSADDPSSFLMKLKTAMEKPPSPKVRKKTSHCILEVLNDFHFLSQY